MEAECVGDMELAVTEACTNVLQHASGTNTEYEVGVEVNETLCEIRVTDTGQGFDPSDGPEAEPTSESGRGIQLMKALVDRVQFVSKPQDGTIVHLIKELKLTENSALRALGAATGS